MVFGRFLYLVLKDIGKNLKKELFRMSNIREIMRSQYTEKELNNEHKFI